MNAYCQVNICVEDGKPHGMIFGLDHNISFDPLLILSELRYTEVYIDMHSSEEDYDDFDYAYEYAFNSKSPLEIISRRDQYVAIVKVIMQLIKESCYSKNCLDLYKIDFLKSYFDITYQFTASNNVPNYMKHYAPSAPDNLELAVHFSYYSVESVLKCDVTDFHNYFYECSSTADLIYSILHFLALSKYKFNQCQHCGKYFATKSHKQKYCSRYSTYSNFEHLNCEQAVRNILQDLRRKRKTINENLIQNYYNKYEKFYKDSRDVIDKVIFAPNIENIKSAYFIINKDKLYTKRSNKK